MRTNEHTHKRGFFALLLLLGLVLLAPGCYTTGTGGVVQIGPDTYMVGSLGKFTDFSGSAVKARLYKQAEEFCKAKGGVMVPINSTAKDSGMGTYASAEVQFMCLPPSDPRAKGAQVQAEPPK